MPGFFRRLWPGLPLGLLLLPTAAAWLDLARGAAGERHRYREAARRIVVLGFDGIDHAILQEYLDRLPTVAALAREGCLLPCRTTNPPESPVAWATFATGRNPGGHGIFDFVRRDLGAEDQRQPLNGMVERVPPEVGVLGFPLRPPTARNLRDGEGFWEPVARAGWRVSVLRMPLTFPARLARGGELLCGLGVPDLRATQGSYTLFAAGPDAWEGHTQFGGRHLKIYPRPGAAAESVLEGPPDPRRSDGGRMTVPVRFTFGSGTATVRLGDSPAEVLEEGRYGAWIPVRFRSGPFLQVDGLVRFLLLRGGSAPAVYASPIQIAPHRPPLPLSAPPGFAGAMADRLGLKRTSGWPEDTFAANDGVLKDAHLFRDILDTYRSHERLCLDRLDHSGAALLTMVFTAQDRVSHMFFRYRDPLHPAHDPAAAEAFAEETGVPDPIFESYRWMDETLAAVRRRLGPRDVLIVVSDHGFHSWRYGVNLNTWLRREGYLALAGAVAGERNLDQFFRTGSETAHIAWPETRAYALGLGQIYLNLAGRERDGVVDPAERDALLAEMRGKLLELRGPDGNAVFTEVYRSDDIWHGRHVRDAPDLQCAFAPGYRVSWQTALLGVPPGVFEENRYPWSGDHCSNDQRETPGIFLANRALAAGADPGLENIAPTVCELFGVPPPEGADAPPLRFAPR